MSPRNQHRNSRLAINGQHGGDGVPDLSPLTLQPECAEPGRPRRKGESPPEAKRHHPIATEEIEVRQSIDIVIGLDMIEAIAETDLGSQIKARILVARRADATRSEERRVGKECRSRWTR